MYKWTGVVLVGTLLLPLVSSAQSACATLSLGSRGADVNAVQKILYNAYKGFPSPTGYFGPLTQAAVKQWQSEHKIVSSGTPATTGYGAVGPKTRAAMGLSCSSASSTTVTKPAAPSSNATLIQTLLAQVRILQAKLAALIAANAGTANTTGTGGTAGGGGGGSGGNASDSAANGNSSSTNQLPNMVFETLTKVWTGTAGEDGGVSVALDSGFVYVALDTNPAKIVKIDKSTMQTVSEWTGSVGENAPYEIFIASNRIYLSLRTTPTKVVQIDMSTLQRIAEWTGAPSDPEAKILATDGRYLYAALYGPSAGKVAKIDTTTMTTSGMWTGALGENYAQGITYENGYLYVGLDLQPAEIVKVDAATMQTVPPSVANNIYYDSALNMSTYPRGAQKLSLAAGQSITGVDLMMDKVGSPTGTISVRLLNAVDDSVVASLGSLDATMLTADPRWYSFRPSTAIAILAAGEYRVVAQLIGGDAANYPRVRYDSSNRTNGAFSYGTATAWADAPNADLSLRVFPNSHFYAQNREPYGGHYTANGKMWMPTYDDASSLVEIDNQTMMETRRWKGTAGFDLATVADITNGRAVIAYDTVPGRISFVDIATMTKVGSWTGASGQNHFYDIVSDGTYVFVPVSSTPAQVVRKAISSRDETGL